MDLLAYTKEILYGKLHFCALFMTVPLIAVRNYFLCNRVTIMQNDPKSYTNLNLLTLTKTNKSSHSTSVRREHFHGKIE